MLSDTKRTVGLQTELSCLCNLLHTRDGKLYNGTKGDFLKIIFMASPVLSLGSTEHVNSLFVNTHSFKIGSEHYNRFQIIILCLTTAFVCAQHRHKKSSLWDFFRKKYKTRDTSDSIHWNRWINISIFSIHRLSRNWIINLYIYVHCPSITCGELSEWKSIRTLFLGLCENFNISVDKTNYHSGIYLLVLIKVTSIPLYLKFCPWAVWRAKIQLLWIPSTPWGQGIFPLVYKWTSSHPHKLQRQPGRGDHW